MSKHEYASDQTLDRVVARAGQALHIGLIGIGPYRPMFDGETIDTIHKDEHVVTIEKDGIVEWVLIASGSWADWGTDPKGDHDENIHIVVCITDDTTMREVEQIRAHILDNTNNPDHHARLTDMTFVDDGHEWGSNQSVLIHLVNSPGPYRDDVNSQKFDAALTEARTKYRDALDRLDG